MAGRLKIDPALDPSEFRARQRRVLESITAWWVFAIAGWLLPGIYVLVGVGFMILEGGAPPIPGLAVVPWISVGLYGFFVARAAIVPLRQRAGRVASFDDDGQYLAEKGGHDWVWAAGVGYVALWAGVTVIFVPVGGAWSVIGWSAVVALGVLTVASGLRSIGVAAPAWSTHPDDAYAALVAET